MEPESGAGSGSAYLPVWAGTLEAAVLAADGDLDGAVTRRARPPSTRPRSPRRLRTAGLVRAGPGDGRRAAPRRRAGRRGARGVRSALARTPSRIFSLAGYARSAVAAGRADIAERASGQLAALLENADEGSAERAEARAFLSDEDAGSDG